VFEAMVETGEDPAAIVEARGLRQIEDADQIRYVVESILRANPALVEQYRAGKQKLFGAFVGQVMKATAGRAKPAMVNDILKRELSKE
jgi:aspartyl-tRNA(Asn)/glutamyl-tRNA(Gln) amidotransferase subunit B